MSLPHLSCFISAAPFDTSASSFIAHGLPNRTASHISSIHPSILPLPFDMPRSSRPRLCPHAAVSCPPAPDKHNPLIPHTDAYHKQYAESVSDPDAFWRHVADSYEWHQDTTCLKDDMNTVLDFNFDPNQSPVSVRFLPGRRTNICYNALDRWADNPDTRHNIAFYWEGNDPSSRKVVTYAEMSHLVNRFANVLRNDLGVQKGDVVIIYMPMIPELPAAMLACARIGAIHSVVFGGFSSEALAGRILDSKARVIVVAHSVARAKKQIPLKDIADKAISISEKAGHQVHYQVVTGTKDKKDMLVDGRDVSWEDAVENASPDCPVEWVPSEHPLFILYTSGSTGKPKGIVHHTAGYMVYAGTTFKYSFDFHPGDIFFSTSDCGWITGHSYVTYGPMLNGAAQVLFEGVPTYPNAGRLWELVARYRVTQIYTAPTVIRSLKGASPPPSTGENPQPTADDWVHMHDRSSLRVLGTVGEPINPETWCWYFDVVGDRKCAIVDTWWQTETGGHCLTPLPIPGLELKPGSAMMPFFGIVPALLDNDGNEIDGAGEGFLVIKKPWPSTLRTVFGDHKRMEETYFSRFPGYYMTGDGARRDKDGHYWLTGRVDDILNVSGHRIGTAEVESAIVLHENVAEAAVVGVPHPIKGEAIYAYVTLMAGVDNCEDLRNQIRLCVRKEIGPFAAPDTVHWAPALPKTRSGKIMRRILRKIAATGRSISTDDLGDISTLTDPGVVASLLATYGK